MSQCVQMRSGSACMKRLRPAGWAVQAAEAPACRLTWPSLIRSSLQDVVRHHRGMFEKLSFPKLNVTKLLTSKTILDFDREFTVKLCGQQLSAHSSTASLETFIHACMCSANSRCDVILDDVEASRRGYCTRKRGRVMYCTRAV
jgi:hypothetical protein